MIGIADRDRADAMGLGAPDHVARGMGGHDLAHAVMAVDHADRADIDDLLRRRDRLGRAGLQARDIPGQAHQPMGLMAPQIGLDQRVGRQPRVVRRHADLGIGGGGEGEQPFGRERHEATMVRKPTAWSRYRASIRAAPSMLNGLVTVPVEMIDPLGRIMPRRRAVATKST